MGDGFVGRSIYFFDARTQELLLNECFALLINGEVVSTELRRFATLIICVFQRRLSNGPFFIYNSSLVSLRDIGAR